MKLVIKEEGGCELYNIYADGELLGHIDDGVIIETHQSSDGREWAEVK